MTYARDICRGTPDGKWSLMDKNVISEIVGWFGTYSPFSWETFVSGTRTLLATLTGGLLTFGFVLLKSTRDRRETEIAAGTRALFTLMAMWNGMKQHQKEVVDPYRGKKDAWLNLHVSQPLDSNLTFDMKDLTFVMQSAPNVFMQILLEENRYRLATYMVEEHRRLATQIVWPRLEAAGIKLGGEPRPEAEIQAIIGPAALKQMQVITAGIINNVDENVRSMEAAFRALRSELVRLFPKIKFVNFDFNPKQQPYFYPHGP
jgi:hypothetical protein